MNFFVFFFLSCGNEVSSTLNQQTLPEYSAEVNKNVEF